MGKRQRRNIRAQATEATEPTPRYSYEELPEPDLSLEEERAQAVRALGAFGLERIRLVQQLDNLDTSLRPRVERAVAAGVPYRRITELTGYSRSTISRWAHTSPSDDGGEAT